MKISEIKLTEKRKNICRLLNIDNLEEAFSYYPYRYENMDATKIEDIKINERIVVLGRLISYPSTFRYGKKSSTHFKIMNENAVYSITIYNRPWINNLHTNELITVVGKYEGNNKIIASNYYAKEFKDDESLIPLYPLKNSIKQNEIKRLMEYLFENYADTIIDLLPLDIRNDHQLINKKEALQNIHFPSSISMLKKALSRLKYEEFLRFYIALNIVKGKTIVDDKYIKDFDENKLNTFINSFPFEFSLDQKKCVEDLKKDFRSNKVIYRLIQGEVGSGKTAVSEVALYLNYLSGYMGTLLAPTEILARQHYLSLKKHFDFFGVKVGLLCSGVEDEKVIKEQIKNQEYDIVVGTHSLFSKDVVYPNLGLVIADEQQRFGVKQRNALRQKGEDADLILMSATPIPRTLASTIYGDIDISTIETMPLNRKGCDTFLINKNSIVDIIDDLKKKLQEGRQIYIVCAAIDKSDNYDAKDVISIYNSLIDIFSTYKMACLYGKLSSEEKEKVMNDFNENKVQILVTTTVVEVGINVKNATEMVIYDADKFGLAQIHQLRGRIQRGEYRGNCYLLTSSKEDGVLQRLEVLVKYNDGFKISLEDLKLRGPGDILGTRQSGIPDFVLANILKDTRFIEAAKKDAYLICNNLDNQEYQNYYEDIYKNATKKYLD